MKRWKRIIIWLFLLCIGMSGCRGIRNNEGDEGKADIVREEIVLWSYYETRDQQLALDDLVEGFNKSQEQYHMIWEYYGPVTEFNKQIAIGITQNQLPDMVIIDNPDMGKYVEQGTFEDITEPVAKMQGLEDYYANVLGSVVYDERYYGFPFCCNNVALIYNKDIFEAEQAEIPETWDQFQQTAVALSNETRQGFAMSAIDGEQAAFQILPWILSAGDSIEALGGDGTLEAFRLIDGLVKEGALAKNCINWSQNDIAKKFIAGECAMMENGPWVIPALNEAGVNYGIAKLPEGEMGVNIAGGENIGVLKDKNVEGAMAFITYYHEDANMLNANLRANSIPPKKAMAARLLSVKPEYDIFVEQMEGCVSRAAYPDWARKSNLLSDAQFDVITGNNTPEEVADRLKAE